MSVLLHIFGRKAPTADAIFKEISAHNAEKLKEQDRAQQAKAALANVTVLTDAEHAAAENDLAAANRAIVRIEARIAELQAAHTKVVDDETLAALKVRAAAARRLVEVDAPKALNTYEEHAQKAADAVGEYESICNEVEAVNIELRKAGLKVIESPETRYRKEADRVIPEERVKRMKFVRFDHRRGHDVDIGITGERNGRRVPLDGHGNVVADAREVDASYVIPAKTIRGEYLPSLIENLSLPPALVGSVRYWPKG